MGTSTCAGRHVKRRSILQSQSITDRGPQSSRLEPQPARPAGVVLGRLIEVLLQQLLRCVVYLAFAARERRRPGVRLRVPVQSVMRARDVGERLNIYLDSGRFAPALLTKNRT